MHPGVTRAEEESDLGAVKIRVRVGGNDFGDVELEATRVSKPELVEGDNRAVIGSDLGGADFGDTNRGEEEKKERGEEKETIHGSEKERKKEFSNLMDFVFFLGFFSVRDLKEKGRCAPKWCGC